MGHCPCLPHQTFRPTWLCQLYRKLFWEKKKANTYFDLIQVGTSGSVSTPYWRSRCLRLLTEKSQKVTLNYLEVKFFITRQFTWKKKNTSPVQCVCVCVSPGLLVVLVVLVLVLVLVSREAHSGLSLCFYTSMCLCETPEPRCWYANIFLEQMQLTLVG